MRNRVKHRILAGLAAGACILAAPLSKRATDGLTMAKLQGDISLFADESHPILEELIASPLTYLGRGAQSFSFASSDGHYVLKIFSQHAGRTPLSKVAPLLPNQMRERVGKTAAKRRSRMEQTLCGYQLAFDEMREETGLIFLHMGKTVRPLPATLIDKIGIAHAVDLSSLLFAIQKRAQPAYPTLRKWAEDGRVDRAKEGVAQLVSLLKIRCKKGIADQDANLETNFGFLETGAIQYDPGRYRRDESRREQSTYSIDLIRYTDRMSRWLKSFSPELATHLHEEVERAQCEE